LKKLFLAVIVLSLSSLTFAGTLNATPDNNQQQTAPGQQKAADAQAPHSILASGTCAFNFSSGSNNTFLSYCVSANGNVFNLVTPVNQQQLFGREGYGICDINSNTEYFDYGLTGDTTNWQAATVLSHTATKVKIARTTSDGIWTLTQTIAQIPSSSSVKVTMALKNNTGVSREVQLSRFADIDAGGLTHSVLDATINDAMIFNSVGRGNSFGLALQNVGTSPFTYLGFVQNTSAPLLPCTPFTHQVIGPIVNTDGAGVMTYVITIPARATKTVNVGYKGL
jgi:hypothetical protein